MRLATRAVAAGVILGVVGGAFVGASHLATAQSQGNSTAPLRDVSVSTPDGGTLRVGIDDSVRLDVSATTPPGSYLAVAGDETGSVLRTETTGPAGAPVTTTISGTPTFSLPASTLSLLAGQRNCSYLPLGNPPITGTAVALPRSATQTGITIQAHDFGSLVDYVSCWPGIADAGPLPNCANDGGVGYVIHTGGAVDFDLVPANEVKCLACVHGSNPAQQNANLAGGVTSCVP